VNRSLFSAVQATLSAVERDLLADGGPQISTMRNYRFAIAVYRPSDEYELRAQLRSVLSRLRAHGWAALELSLSGLLVERLRRTLAPEVLEARINQEKRLFAKQNQDGPARALAQLGQLFEPIVEEQSGIAQDVIDRVQAFSTETASHGDKRVVFVSHLGGLYPFYRSSALLKRLDGHTNNIPLVLLYPGEKREEGGLSFMGQLAPDRDYRPRIYGADAASGTK
jgi:hypothetical protein